MRARFLLLVTFLLTACSSSGGDGAVAAGQREAKSYTCPPVAHVAQAAGVPLPAARRVPFKDLSISCDYVSTKIHGHTLIVTLTFGAGANDLDSALRLLPKGSKTEKVAIAGGRAYSVTDPDGSTTLYAQAGDRLVSVVGDTALSGTAAVAVARIFF